MFIILLIKSNKYGSKFKILEKFTLNFYYQFNDIKISLSSVNNNFALKIFAVRTFFSEHSLHFNNHIVYI